MSIAVEMVAKPEVLLFLGKSIYLGQESHLNVSLPVIDEPTSGLDSQTAWSICMLLRKLVAHGQAVMCTVHQPSAVLLELFDQLLLLEQPGRTIYFGPLGKNSGTMVNYFIANGARTPKLNENPADWVFDVTKRTAEEESIWGPIWDRSPEKHDLLRELNVIRSKPTVKTSVRHGGGEYAAPTLAQLRMILLRTSRDTWRTPAYLWSVVALCFGMVSPPDNHSTSYSLTESDTGLLHRLLLLQIPPISPRPHRSNLLHLSHPNNVQQSATAPYPQIPGAPQRVRSSRAPIQNIQLESIHFREHNLRRTMAVPALYRHLHCVVLPCRLIQSGRFEKCA